MKAKKKKLRNNTTQKNIYKDKRLFLFFTIFSNLLKICRWFLVRIWRRLSSSLTSAPSLQLPSPFTDYYYYIKREDDGVSSYLEFFFDFWLSSSSSYTLSFASRLTSLINNEPLLDWISYFVSKIEKSFFNSFAVVKSVSNRLTFLLYRFHRFLRTANKSRTQNKFISPVIRSLR